MEISKMQLSVIEKSLDKLFNKLGLDVEFSGHFLERLNDSRNGEPITISELINVYNSLYDKFGIKLSKTDSEIEEVVKSISTMINIPLNINFNKKSKKIELMAKTIMRKQDFKTPSPVLKVESFVDFASLLLNENLESMFNVRKPDFDGNAFSLSLYKLKEHGQSTECGRVEFATKPMAKKFLQSLIKQGLVEKRGYDYISTSNRDFEVRQNF